MTPLLASASGIGLMVIADHVLESLAKKAVEAGSGDAAKLIADFRADKRKQRRFAELMDGAWGDLRQTHAKAASAIRTALLERNDASETFCLEALKLLLFAQDPRLDELARTYTWSRGLLARREVSLHPWEEVSEPLTLYFDLLRRRLLDDPIYRPKALEKETLDQLNAVYALLQDARTAAGRLAVETHPRSFTDSELAAARNDYLAMLRQEYQYLDLAGLAPKVQNRTVKIRLEDIFIPLEARPEVARRRPLPREIGRMLQEGRADPQELIKLDEELSVLVTDGFRPAALAEWLAEHDYAVPGYERGALGEGERLDILQLLALGQVVVLGDPGSGKSTLLKYLTYAIAAGKADLIGPSALEKLPLLIKIIDFVRTGDDRLSLKTYLCRADDDARCVLFEDAIESGKALILLDALDEVPDGYSRGRATEAVRRFVADHPGNTVLLTSRIVGYDAARLTGHFQHATLEKLPQEAIACFVGNWYAAIEREAESSEETIQAAYARAEDLQQAIRSNPGVQALAENPLLLTIIALVNWRGRKLPDRRVELYQHAAETLIESWPFTQRGVKLDTRVGMGILEPVAYRIFAQRSSEELDETILGPILVKAIGEKRGCSPAEAAEQADELLPQITEQSGIFVERGVDPAGRRYYGFLHQTFAEYFTARHLAERWLAGGVDLLPYARNPRCHEVLLLMAGHLGLTSSQLVTRLIGELLELPDEYPQLQRNLLLAAACLADDTPVQANAGRYVMRQLAALVCKGPAALRDAAYPLLTRLGGTAHAPGLTERLLEFSRDEEGDVRSWAASALGHVGGGGAQAVNRLLELIRGEDITNVRARAAAALASMGSVGHLLALSRDEEGDVRRLAVSALGLVGSGDARAVDRLLALMRDEEGGVRASAAVALGSMGRSGNARAVDRLLALSRDEEGDVRANTAVALGFVGSGDARAVDHLLALSRDEDDSVRRLALAALGSVGSGNARAVDRLLELMRDKDDDARVSAVFALESVGGGDAWVVDRLLALSRDEDGDVRGWTAFALGFVGSGNARAVDRLLTLSQDEEGGVRHAAVEALGRVGGGDMRAMDRLLVLSRDEDRDVRGLAIVALGSMGSGDARAVDRLLELSQDEEGDVRRGAVGALGRVGGGDARVMDCLLKLSQGASAGVRGGIARMAKSHGDTRAMPALMSWLDDRQWSFFKDNYMSVAGEAYGAAMAILARAAPEPPLDYEEPPQPVAGPWDEP